MKNVFRINRRLEPGQYRLTEVFADIRTYGILPAIFADAEEIDGVMAHTKVFVVDRPNEMFVDNDDGSITIGLTHLRQRLGRVPVSGHHSRAVPCQTTPAGTESLR